MIVPIFAADLDGPALTVIDIDKTRLPAKARNKDSCRLHYRPRRPMPPMLHLVVVLLSD